MSQLHIAFASLDQWRASDTLEELATSKDIARATEWVRDPALRLRLPDAIHLAIADRLAATLLTADAIQAAAGAMLAATVEMID